MSTYEYHFFFAFFLQFGIERRHQMFSVSTFSEQMAYWTDLDNCKLRKLNTSSFLLAVVFDVVVVVSQAPQ